MSPRNSNLLSLVGEWVTIYLLLMLATCTKFTNVNNEIKGGRKAMSPTSHAPEAESELA